LWEAVDLIASEYSWSRKEILESVYPDEYIFMAKKISSRRLAEYRIQLAIATNPHVKDQKPLWEQLKDPNQPDKAQEFDSVGFEILKAKMRGTSGSRVVVKD
jgi:hypothetical protein